MNRYESFSGTVPNLGLLGAAEAHLTDAFRRPSWRGGDAREQTQFHLEVVSHALFDYSTSLRADDGLLEELRFDAPRLFARAEALATQVDEVAAVAIGLVAKVEDAPNGDELAVIEDDAGVVLSRLRDSASTAFDLEHERFDDPPAMD
jgi:hypothetical protein